MLVYAIRVATIQELRLVDKDKVTIDSLIDKLTTFELISFDNSVQKFESTFQASVSNALTRKEKEIYHSHEYRSNREDDDEGNLMEIEALLAIRLPRGTRKYKGNLPLKCYSYNKIGHIVANYPNEDQKEKFKKFKGKGKKYCYVVVDEGVTDEEFDDEYNEEILFVVVKEDISNKKALISHIDNCDDWIIDSGCSHQMTGDRSKFLTLLQLDSYLHLHLNGKDYLLFSYW